MRRTGAGGSGVDTSVRVGPPSSVRPPRGWSPGRWEGRRAGGHPQRTSRSAGGMPEIAWRKVSPLVREDCVCN